MNEIGLKDKVKSLLLIIIIIWSGSIIMLFNFTEYRIVKAESTWRQTSDLDFNNGTLINLTTEGSGETANLLINLTESRYWTDKTPTPRPANYPGQRNYHSMAGIYGTNKILLYGGSWSLDDTWVYDPDVNTWTRMYPKTTPGFRRYPKMTSVFGDDKVVLFGGYTSSPTTYLNETWVYDLSDNNWTNMNPTNISLITGRYAHGMSSIYGTARIMVYGGYIGSSTYVYDTWIYDLTNNSWIDKTNPSNKPNVTRPEMASIHGTDKVVMFGGNGSSYETWVFDLSDNTWTMKTPNPEPEARYQHAMSTIYGSDLVLLFGGRLGTTTYYGDTWLYDLNDGSEGSWTKKILTPSPPARYSHYLAPSSLSDRVVLFGGRTSLSEVDDTWVYRHTLSIINGTYISKCFDTCSNSSFDTISWNADIPDYTDIKVQLRTADNGSNMGLKAFVGPDGTAQTFYTQKDGEPLWPGHSGDRWMQYKIYFTMDIFTESPKLKDITISYNCLPTVIVIGPVNNSLISNNKPTFAWTFDDFDSDDQKAFQVIINDNLDFSNIAYDSNEQQTVNQHWDFPMGTDYTELADGVWYWKVHTKDQDDAWTEYSAPFKFMIDTKSPSSAPTWPINNEYYYDLNLIKGVAYDIDGGSGLASIELAIKRLDINNYWNGITWKPLLTWLPATGTNDWTYDTSLIQWSSGVQYSIQSRAMDNASNVETLSSINVFNIDQTGPESIINSPSSVAWLAKVDSIAGTSKDFDGAGVNYVEISIKCNNDNSYWDGTTWDSFEAWLEADETESWSYNTSNIQWITGNNYTIISRARDNVNNFESTLEGINFKFDNIAPSHSMIINDNDDFTNLRDVKLSLAAADIGSGITEMSFSTDGITWTSWVEFNTTGTFKFPAGDGEKKLNFRVRDLAGNIADPIFDIIILDTTPPEQVSVKIMDDDEYTSSSLVSLTLNATDSLSGVSDMSFNTDGVTWSAWEPFTSSKSITLPPGDGEKTVKYRVRDRAGNIVETNDTIKLDTTPPYSLSIMINDGATETNSTIVVLKLSALDNLSGVHQASFSTDGKSWSVWETFVNSISFTLPLSNGEKTIYFKVKDHAGNIAGPVSAMITLKESSPEDENQSTEKDKTSTDLILWLGLIVVVIIVIFIIIIVFLVLKRKKRAYQEVVPAGAIMIKPGGLSGPVISINNTSPTPLQSTQPSKISVLGSSTTRPATVSVLPSPQAQEQSPVPSLVKSTESTIQPTPQVQPQLQPQLPGTTTGQPSYSPTQALPQLPPGVANQTVTVDSGGEQTSISLPGEHNTQINAQIQIQQAPQTIQPIKTDQPEQKPVVHLHED